MLTSSLKEWTPREMYPLGFRIVAGTANRFLFSLDLARNEIFESLSINYTSVAFGGADVIKGWPEFLKPLVLYLRTGNQKGKSLALARSVAGPMIEKRIREED